MAKKKKENDEEVAEGEEAAAPSKMKGILMNVLVFLLVSGIAGGAGFGASMFLEPVKSAGMADEQAMDDGDKEEGDKDEDGGDDKEMADQADAKDKDKDKEDPNAHLTGYAKPLKPILTNLASPTNVWVRMELALVTKKDATEELLEQIHQDLFGYMRTVKLHHVEGPSGYLNLRAQLSERAILRSKGEVEKVLVRTMLFE